MPQIKTSDYDELLKFLQGKDIQLTKKKVRAKTLKATQRNFNRDKIVSAAANYHKLHKAKPIIVSSDNYIIDGHHRWLGAYNVNCDIHIYHANVNINDLLDAVKQFPKSYTKNINEESNEL
jgi:GTP-sensing pleiotropic transcriptional regulator CodY